MIAGHITGPQSGTIVAQGTPEQVAKAGKGHTGLAAELQASKYV